MSSVSCTTSRGRRPDRRRRTCRPDGGTSPIIIIIIITTRQQGNIGRERRQRWRPRSSRSNPCSNCNRVWRHRRATTRRRPRRQRWTVSRASSVSRDRCARDRCPFIDTCVGVARNSSSSSSSCSSLSWQRASTRTRSVARRAVGVQPPTRGWQRDERCAMIIVVYVAACAVLYVLQSATRASTSYARTTAASTCANGLTRVMRYRARFTTRTRSVSQCFLAAYIADGVPFELIILGLRLLFQYLSSFFSEIISCQIAKRIVEYIAIWVIITFWKNICSKKLWKFFMRDSIYLFLLVCLILVNLFVDLLVVYTWLLFSNIERFVLQFLLFVQMFHSTFRQNYLSCTIVVQRNKNEQSSRAIFKAKVHSTNDENPDVKTMFHLHWDTAERLKILNSETRK